MHTQRLKTPADTNPASLELPVLWTGTMCEAEIIACSHLGIPGTVQYWFLYSLVLADSSQTPKLTVKMVHPLCCGHLSATPELRKTKHIFTRT